MTAPAASGLFYLGPIGSMLPLPDVYSDVAVPSTRVGGTHTSLNGTRTIDTFAYKRGWAWSWSNLMPWHVPFVDALQMGMVPGPLRLIDPRRINRWPEQIATGGSHQRTPRGFNASTGSTAYRSLNQVTAASSTLPPAPVLRGCLEWNLPAAGGGTLTAVTPAILDNTTPWQVPVLPGETVRFSAWVAGSSAINVQVAWSEQAADGTTTNHTGSPLTLQGATWQPVLADITPAATTVAITGWLSATSGSAAGTVITTAWFFGGAGADTNLTAINAHITEFCGAPADPFGGWRPGGGAPVVVVDSGALTYRRPGLNDAALTVLET